ncbi:MAG: hypothetical protein AAFV74_21620 [Pseudomonadota bacterium]
MSDHDKSENTPNLKKPFMLAYSVKPIGDGKKSIWTKIGAAWAHKDDQGYEVRMEAVPLDGRLVLRAVKETDADQTGEIVDRSPG